MKKVFSGLAPMLVIVSILLAGCAQAPAAPTATTAPAKPAAAPTVAPAAAAPTAAPAAATAAPATAAPAAAAATKAPTKTVKDAGLIAFVNPLSGVYAASAKEPMGIAELMVEDINQQGGLTIGDTQYTLKWVTGDSLGTAAGGTKVAEELTRQYPELRVIVSGSTLASPTVGDVAATKKISVLGNAYDEEFPSTKHGFNFRAFGLLYETSPSFWKWLAANRPNVKSLMTVFWDDASGQKSTDTVNKAAKKYGINVVGNEFYPSSTTDFYPIAQRVLAKNPDAVEFFYYSTGLAKQLRELGYKGLIIASSFRDAMWNTIPASVTEGMIFLNSIDPTDEKNTPKLLRDFSVKYQARFNIPAPPSALFWGLNYQIAIDAMKNAGVADGDALKSYIQNQPLNTSYGQVRAHGKEIIGQNNWVLFPQPIVEMKAGKPQLLNMVSSEDAYKAMMEVYGTKQ